MRHPMSQTTRRELIASIWPRYREARWDDKQRILDEFTAATGYHRKYAIAVLNHPPAERPLPIHHTDRAIAMKSIAICASATHGPSSAPRIACPPECIWLLFAGIPPP